MIKKISSRTLERVHTHTHTSNLINRICKIEKDNIIIPCGYTDTG